MASTNGTINVDSLYSKVGIPTLHFILREVIMVILEYTYTKNNCTRTYTRKFKYYILAKLYALGKCHIGDSNHINIYKED